MPSGECPWTASGLAQGEESVEPFAAVWLCECKSNLALAYDRKVGNPYLGENITKGRMVPIMDTLICP